MTGTLKSNRIFNRFFTSIFIANACLSLSQQMTNSLIAIYADYLGATAAIVGIVASTFAVTALLFKIVSAPMADTFNRRYILMGAMLVLSLVYFGYSISHSVSTLIFFRLLQGAAMAFTATCSLALAADSLPAEKFSTGIGIFSMAQAASMAIGPTIALALAAQFGYTVTFSITGAMMLLAVLVASQVKVDYKKTKNFSISLDRFVAKEALVQAALLVFLMMTFSVIGAFLILYAGIKGVANIGFYFTVYACTLLFTRPLVGKLTDKFGLVKLLVPAMGIFALSFYIISIADTLPMFLLAAFISGFGFGACQPAIQSLTMKCVPSERRGAGSSTNFIGMDIGILTGPVIAGFLVENFGFTTMWRLMIIPIFIAFCLVIIYRRRIKQIEDDFENQNLGGSAPKPPQAFVKA